MINFDDLHTKKGTKVIVHFETDHEREMTDRYFTQPTYENHLAVFTGTRRHIRNWDTGKGKTVHILINKDNCAIDVLTEEEFAEWQKNPSWEKHLSPEPDSPMGEFPELLDALLGDHAPGLTPGLAFLSDLFGAGSRLSNAGKFNGPTAAQVAKYEGNDAAQELGHYPDDEQCQLCLAITCPGRSLSFDELAFDKALATTA
jgi:hypothetical protein